MRRSCSSAALVLGLVLTSAGLGAVGTPASAAPAASTSACGSMADPVYQTVKPSNDASLLTPWENEADRSKTYGFTQSDGALFKASIIKAPDLVEVHRLYRGRNLDFSAAWSSSEIEQAVEDGYKDQGKSFYASATPTSCTVPVYRFTKSSKHRFAVTSSSRQSLTDAGWTSEGAVFYAAPADVEDSPAPDTDPEFTFAVYPDTQQEVGTDGRFVDRANWLVANRDKLDLRFVTHTGDVVNWDTADHAQYEVASKALRPLETAKIPYSLAIGNHDTQATGPGGGARDPKRTRQLVRDTHVFNQYFNAARFGGVSGAYEKDKVDNTYSMYEDGGVKWLVLVLELWPRQGAVDWAKQVVAAHPDDNVIVVTHDYLDANGDIEQSSEYGDTSPQELYDSLISQYANIRIVLSGHVGVTGQRVDTGKNGNKIYSFLTTIHAAKTNPIRLFTVNTAEGTLKTRVYAPWTDQTWPEATETVKGIKWVR